MDANSAPASEIRVEQKNVMIYWMLPWLLALVTLISWTIIIKSKRQSDKKLNARFVTTYIFILFLIFPSLVQIMVDQFNCQEYDEELRSKIDLQVECWEGWHKVFSLYVALPGIILYGIGIPAGVFYLMRRDKDRLDTVNVKEKFGFLFNGYKRKYYYWEIAIMYRKVLMIFISVFLNRIGLIVQALVILIVLVFFIQVNNLRRPFADRALNEIENLSLLTATVTIYCGIFFLSAEDKTSQSFDKNRDFSLDESGSVILFLLITGSNILFILVWSIKFYFIVREMVREKYPEHYIRFFLCCRKDRWVRENTQRAKNEKNEYMIAKIEDLQYFMKDMKSMYIAHINYEGHEEFMKMLYLIEDMIPKIDMTIKKNEFKIDGKIARERRFDPEHLNRALDDKKLYIEDSSESKASYSNSDSIEKKRDLKSLNMYDEQNEKYIPESKNDFLRYFEKRDKIYKINKNQNRLYEELSKEKRDLTPYNNAVEEKKMKNLEGYFKKKLKEPANKSMYKRDNTSSLNENSVKKSVYSTQQHHDVSIDDQENTTSNQIMQGYSDFEQDMTLNDNYMSQFNISRNAKVLMRRTRETPDGVDNSYRIDRDFSMPAGEMIEEEEDLKVDDYEEDNVTQLSKIKTNPKNRLSTKMKGMIMSASSFTRNKKVSDQSGKPHKIDSDMLIKTAEKPKSTFGKEGNTAELLQNSAPPIISETSSQSSVNSGKWSLSRCLTISL